MNRLISFGCSYTYGTGLDDCYVAPNDPGPNPSKYAYPNLVATKLNRECINMAANGISNLAILDAILQYDFLPNDLVTVMWTYKTRDMVYTSPTQVEHKGRWLKDWIKQQNTYDMYVKSLLHIHHAYLYLKNKDVDFYFLDVDTWKDVYEDFSPAWMYGINFIEFDKKLEMIPPNGLDKVHPGPNFHKALANIIVGYLNENNQNCEIFGLTNI